jgi:Skp family chaperone for outer membrane proteins
MKHLCLVLFAACAFAQTQTSAVNPGYCGGSSAAWEEMREDLQEEIADTQKLIGGMSARVLMLRNDAGSIQGFNGRDALQIDADLWQSLIDHMKARNQKRQDQVERCDARAKIAAAAEAKPKTVPRKR